MFSDGAVVVKTAKGPLGEEKTMRRSARVHQRSPASRLIALLLACGLVMVACSATESRRNDTSPGYEMLRKDMIVHADLWDGQPKMMAAGLGFTSIIGVPSLSTDKVPSSKTLTRLAGGTWNTVQCAGGEQPSLQSYTSAATPSAVKNTYGQDVYYSDGLPVEFSWPILPSTLDATDFKVTLNDGTRVTPQVASIWPNFEYNERSVAVLFGHFGNRVSPAGPGAIYPTSVEVVTDDTPLQLVGPGSKTVTAAGFKAETNGSPYTDPDVAPSERGGPRLIAAKLTKLSTDGDTGPKIFQQNLPNDGHALYGDKAKFRLRVYTSGGMTPDGVRAVFPTDFSRFFRLQALALSGETVTLTETGTNYTVDGHTLRVVGLADLGKKQSTYDDCYAEDKDNYIDIILDGDRAAAERITTVEIPSDGAYSPFYNPGGPGNDPAPDVRYSAPTPPISQPVTIALDDPMTVTYHPR